MSAAVVRVFKSYGAPNNKPWVNTYIIGDGNSPPDNGQVIIANVAELYADAFVAAERAFHYTPIYFNKVTISSFKADSAPYNPDVFFTKEYNLQGLRDGGAPEPPTLEDLRICLVVKRQTLGGRTGSAWYRGALLEADVKTVAGRMQLEAGTLTALQGLMDTGFADLVQSGGIDEQQLGLVTGTMQAYEVDRTVRRGGVLRTEQVWKRRYIAPFRFRVVDRMVVHGASIRQTDNEYWDRA